MFREDGYQHFHVFITDHGRAQVIFFIVKTHIFRIFVLNTPFHSIFDVVISAVLVVNYPGYIIRLTPAVILLYVLLGIGFFNCLCNGVLVVFCEGEYSFYSYCC